MLASNPHNKKMVGFRSPEVFITRKAVWSEELKGWTLFWIGRLSCSLKFKGRVKKASKRNCQLIMREDSGESSRREIWKLFWWLAAVYLCFGKVSSKKYSMDYAAPLSSIQAFAASLTSFQKKKLAALYVCCESWVNELSNRNMGVLLRESSHKKRCISLILLKVILNVDC